MAGGITPIQSEGAEGASNLLFLVASTVDSVEPTGEFAKQAGPGLNSMSQVWTIRSHSARRSSSHISAGSKEEKQ